MDELHGGQCLPCAADYYNSGYSANICQRCPADQVTGSEGKTSAQHCCKQTESG